jgi:hypothetical protein
MTQSESDGTPVGSAAAGGPGNVAPVKANKGPVAGFASPPPYFEEALEDAERLLKYAAEIGADVDDGVRDAILAARAAKSSGWNEDIVADLLAAFTHLSARLAPVTAQSLRARNVETRRTVRNYWIVALCLAALIVPFSVFSFVTSAISTELRQDIASANDLAVKLRSQLGPPSAKVVAAALPPAVAANETSSTPEAVPSSPSEAASAKAPAKSIPVVAATTESQIPKGSSDVEIITELQDFAATVRAIDARARQLNWFVLHAVQDPFQAIRNDSVKLHNKFQLPVGLNNYSEAAVRETYLYQDVRYFAQNLLDDVSFYYGAVTTCLLPVLYALLGTCAYLLRSFEDQMKNRTYTPSHANSARFLIAGIGGAVVGLFNTLTITQSASISPLAVAFLVGYAVDVFFSFLEGVIQSFTKSRGAPGPSAQKPAPGAPA